RPLPRRNNLMPIDRFALRAGALPRRAEAQARERGNFAFMMVSGIVLAIGPSRPSGLPGTAGRGPACTVVWELRGDTPGRSDYAGGDACDGPLHTSTTLPVTPPLPS